MTVRRSLMIVGFLILCSFSCNLLEVSSSGQDETPSDIVPTRIEETTSTNEPFAATMSPTSIPPSEIPPSPPILKIAYIDDGNIWLIEGGSPPQQLTNSGFAENVLISPDGQKIVFKRRLSFDDLAELRVVNADGGGEDVLLSTDDMKTFYPSTLESKGFEISQMAFLPGTHDLFFNTYEAFATVGVAMTDDLLCINTDSGDLSRILNPNRGGQFAISPDGTRIVVIQPDRIHLANPDGSGLSTNLIIYPPVITYSEFQYYAQPIWTRDSGAIGFAIPSADPLNGSPSGDIWRIPRDGSAAVKIATIAGDFYFSQVFSTTTLSPLFDRVAFMRETATPNVRELYIAQSDGTAETIYDMGEITWAGWAPDGIHFVYSLTDPMDLVIGSVGDPPAPLVTGIDLRWINNRDFLYLSGSMGTWTLMKGSIGTAPISLATPVGDFISYDFTRSP
jgi:Tol biopolymer transport system component